MLYPEISRFFDAIPPQLEQEERGKSWKVLGLSLKNNGMKGAVNFICTHNARRSVLSQCLAAALAHKNGLSGLAFWSGGAEATYVHPTTISTLEKIGFKLVSKREGNNPIYDLAFSNAAEPLRIFSKTFDDASSPAPYHAVMVCSKGDAACPFISGLASRTLLPFEDPGSYDGTEYERDAYYQCAVIIAGELRYFFEELPGNPLSDRFEQTNSTGY